MDFESYKNNSLANINQTNSNNRQPSTPSQEQITSRTLDRTTMPPTQFTHNRPPLRLDRAFLDDPFNRLKLLEIVSEKERDLFEGKDNKMAIRNFTQFRAWAFSLWSSRQIVGPTIFINIAVQPHSISHRCSLKSALISSFWFLRQFLQLPHFFRCPMLTITTIFLFWWFLWIIIYDTYNPGIQYLGKILRPFGFLHVLNRSFYFL